MSLRQVLTVQSRVTRVDDGHPRRSSPRERFDRIVATLAEQLPEVADYLDEARADIVAFTAFPKEVWRQIWSNNPISVNWPSSDTFQLAA